MGVSFYRCCFGKILFPCRYCVFMGTGIYYKGTLLPTWIRCILLTYAKSVRKISINLKFLPKTTMGGWCFRLHTASDLYKSGYDDEGQGQHFGIREDILDASGPFHTGTVHKGQHHYNTHKTVIRNYKYQYICKSISIIKIKLLYTYCTCAFNQCLWELSMHSHAVLMV